MVFEVMASDVGLILLAIGGLIRVISLDIFTMGLRTRVGELLEYLFGVYFVEDGGLLGVSFAKGGAVRFISFISFDSGFAKMSSFD